MSRSAAQQKRDEAAEMLLHYLDIAGQGNAGRRIRGQRDYEVEIYSIVDLILDAAELRIVEKLERAAAAADAAKKRKKTATTATTATPAALAIPEPPPAPPAEPEDEPEPEPEESAGQGGPHAPADVAPEPHQE